jgi:hypothetical protein
MRDRRKPFAEPAVAIPKASEPSMKRKPQAFFWVKKIPQVGNLLWKARPFGIVIVAMREALPAEPKDLRLSPSNAKKRSTVIYDGEDVTR